MTEDKKGILLETGTGELEILEFTVKNTHYAINVIKIKEILEIDYVTKVPKSNPALIGLTMVRGDVIPLIDMNYVLEKEFTPINGKIKTLLCEFNQLKVAFCVDEVHGIHRIGWNLIKKPDMVIENSDSLIIGNITLGERIIMLLDFEKIVTDIAPSTGINESRIGNITKKDRMGIKLILSDDSPMIRQLLDDVLTKAGFGNMKFFNDGQQAWHYLDNLASEKGNRFIEDVQILITDIEMPQMDGHTLTRKIKEHKILRTLPVIIFSSLITDDLKHKGESVKADAQMSKPEVENLVGVIDKLIEKINNVK
ncbi:two-component system, chemotaxis family, response regulator CheV [Acetoanaerobium noterae]|jgi:two-component system chemotaxis response regulator CheV|uniref:Stage 0 sporulation protein A homolog n=1 Tax=Acetoanaerobium noterae TaxID=745369 RepID=A0A1T4ZS11_9FIRM|nr:chemotaxis protein [Acetoanaerobium noterae]MBP8763385.1 chemotaxis protein CheV [Acetoanaerobium sp.]MDK2803360.1 two-component system, chemotaxis family, chemotaxis protein CheV [Peptostreptococcaceae bacterium]SKB25377.1 two-component system, chemotaxis family, response regulator CheV [Acetoanaerobium noterae]